MLLNTKKCFCLTLRHNISFSIYIAPFVYYLVTTSNIEIELNRESSDGRKCVEVLIVVKIIVNY